MARAFLARDDSDMPPRPRAATIIAVVTGSRARSGSPTIGRPRPEVQKERQKDCFVVRKHVPTSEGGASHVLARTCTHLHMENPPMGFPRMWDPSWSLPTKAQDTTWLCDDTAGWSVVGGIAISRAHARAFFFFCVSALTRGLPAQVKVLDGAPLHLRTADVQCVRVWVRRTHRGT